MNSTFIWRKMSGNAFLTNDEREPVNRNRASADTGQRSAGKEEDSRLPEDRRRKMAFQSVDEIDTFSFDDCTVNRLEIRENRISMELEALIVGVKNSQNTHYVRSYAGTTDVRLHGAKLESAVREGFKMYNADNVLVKEEADEPLSEAKLKELQENLAGAWLFRMDAHKEENGRYSCEMEIEVPGEDQYDILGSETYELSLSYDQAVFTWERYRGRVES